MALVLTIGLVVLSANYIASVQSHSHVSLITYAEVEALHTAEAGVEFGIWEIAHGGKDFLDADGWQGTGPKVKTDILSTSGGEAIGEYVVSVDDLGGDSYEIFATGFFPNQLNPISTRTVKVLVERENLFVQAMYGIEEIKIDDFSFVDSYDSRLGPYGGANVSSEGNLITNSISSVSPYATDLGKGTYIDGDVTIGVGGDTLTAIHLEATSVITGSRDTLTRVRLPKAVPDISGFLPYQGNLNVPAHGSATISSSGEYDSITLGAHSTLILDSDVSLYISGKLDLGTYSTLIIDSAASVSVVLNDSLKFKPHAEIVNESFDPKQFTIYCTDNVEKFALGAQGQFLGNVYMPNTDFTVNPFIDYYGSIVAKTVLLKKNTSFHFDKSLADDVSAPTFNNYVVRIWQGY